MTLDLFVAVVLVVGVIRGVRQGFLLSLFSFGGLLVGFWMGWQFAPNLVAVAEREWGWRSSLEAYLAENVVLPLEAGEFFSAALTHAQLAEIILTVAAFLILYMLVRIVAEVVGGSMKRAISWSVLGILDRILGAVFGLLATIFGLAVGFGVISALAPAIPYLGSLARLIEDSTAAHSLARLFYLMGPLRDLITENVPTADIVVKLPYVRAAWMRGRPVA
ncbi:MAG: CvpA family protein [Bacillota bacterium]